MNTFAVEGLDFEQSDTLEMQIAKGIELEVRLYHCSQRHHTPALAEARFNPPPKLQRAS